MSQLGENGHEAPKQLKSVVISMTLTNEHFNYCTRKARKRGLKNIHAYITYLISNDMQEPETNTNF
jgi:hypothetical protein